MVSMTFVAEEINRRWEWMSAQSDILQLEGSIVLSESTVTQGRNTKGK